MMSNDYAFWDAGLYDLPSVYDTAFDLDKATRLAYHESAMTHAMLFTGVDVLDGMTRRWRVENSWGSDRGKDGFYTMDDSWFGQYVFEIAARKNALPADLQSALDAEPIVLPAGPDGRPGPLVRRSGDQAQLTGPGDGLGAVGRAELALLTVSRVTTSSRAMA